LPLPTIIGVPVTKRPAVLPINHRGASRHLRHRPVLAPGSGRRKFKPATHLRGLAEIRLAIGSWSSMSADSPLFLDRLEDRHGIELTADVGAFVGSSGAVRHSRNKKQTWIFVFACNTCLFIYMWLVRHEPLWTSNGLSI
jgi:hypothetical protein